MSGGHYSYLSLKPAQLANDIEADLWASQDPPEIRQAMAACVAHLRAVGEMAHSIEWYMSGDYGPESVVRAHADMLKLLAVEA